MSKKQKAENSNISNGKGEAKTSKDKSKTEGFEMNLESLKELLKRYLFWFCYTYIYYNDFNKEFSKEIINKNETSDKAINKIINMLKFINISSSDSEEVTTKINNLVTTKEKLQKIIEKLSTEEKVEEKEIKEINDEFEKIADVIKTKKEEKCREYKFNDEIKKKVNIPGWEVYLRNITFSDKNESIDIGKNKREKRKSGGNYKELINDIDAGYKFDLQNNQASIVKYNSTYMNIGRYNIVMHKKDNEKDNSFDDYDGFAFEFYGETNLKEEVESNFNNIAKINNYILFEDLFNNEDEKIKNFFEAYFKVYEDHLLTDSLIYLDKNRNLILHGAPGTGKTFLANEIAKKLINLNNNENVKEKLEEHLKEQVKKVQFHPSYDYTDFIEGLRPAKSGNQIVFKRKDGTFKAFCKEASKNKNKNYVFIIDEINRGEISKIFGEIFSLIEKDYRGEDNIIETQYQGLLIDDKKDIFKDGFYIPDNVYIIGTMNDIDKGVDSIDFAIRRRFIWKEIKAKDTQNSILNNKIKGEGKKYLPEIIERMDALNEVIEKDQELGTDYQIGAGYFKNITIDDNGPNYDELWETALEPLLKEYLRGRGNADIKKFKEAYEQKKSNNNKKGKDKSQSNVEDDTSSDVEASDNDE